MLSLNIFLKSEGSWTKNPASFFLLQWMWKIWKKYSLKNAKSRCFDYMLKISDFYPQSVRWIASVCMYIICIYVLYACMHVRIFFKFLKAWENNFVGNMTEGNSMVCVGNLTLLVSRREIKLPKFLRLLSWTAIESEAQKTAGQALEQTGTAVLRIKPYFFPWGSL